MANLTDLRARRDALAQQRASGVARVSYDGKTVDYRSVAEIDRAIEALDREIAAAEISNFVDQLLKIHHLLVELQLPGVSARKIKQIIEQHPHANAFLLGGFQSTPFVVT